MSDEYELEGCRTCGVFSPLQYNYLRSLFGNERDSTIYNILALLKSWNIKVEINDGLPQYICTQCILQLGETYRVQKSCLQVQEELRNWYFREKPDIVIKTECEQDLIEYDDGNNDLEQNVDVERNMIEYDEQDYNGLEVEQDHNVDVDVEVEQDQNAYDDADVEDNNYIGNDNENEIAEQSFESFLLANSVQIPNMEENCELQECHLHYLTQEQEINEQVDNDGQLLQVALENDADIETPTESAATPEMETTLTMTSDVNSHTAGIEYGQQVNEKLEEETIEAEDPATDDRTNYEYEHPQEEFAAQSTIQCFICNEEFNNEEEFDMHYWQAHTNAVDEVLNKEETIAMAATEEDSTDREYVSFSYLSSDMTEGIVENNDEQYSDIEMDDEEKPQFMCPICAKCFSLQFTLNRHLKHHHETS